MLIEDYVFNGEFKTYHVVRTLWLGGQGATVVLRHDVSSVYNKVGESRAEDYTTPAAAIKGHEKWVRLLREELAKKAVSA